MAFKHLNSRQVTDAQWDHVESLGVKTVFDDDFPRGIRDMTVDEERDFYLVSRGMYGPNMTGTGKSIDFYALCLGDNVFYFDVEQNEAGDLWENTYEKHWNIERVRVPDGWNFDSLSVDEFKKIVVEAFTCESIQGVVTPERLKKIVVEFPDNFEKQIKN